MKEQSQKTSLPETPPLPSRRRIAAVWPIVLALLLTAGTFIFLPLANVAGAMGSPKIRLLPVDSTPMPMPPPTLFTPPPPAKKAPAKPRPLPALPQRMPDKKPPPHPLSLPLDLSLTPLPSRGDFSLDFSVRPQILPTVITPQPAASQTPKPDKPEIYEASTLAIRPRPLAQPPPSYPYRARLRGQEGQVRLQFTVRPNGQVDSIKILSATPSGIFDDAACAAVRKWRFTPGRRAGKPVAARMQITLRFKLDQ